MYGKNHCHPTNSFYNRKKSKQGNKNSNPINQINSIQLEI